MKNLIQKPLLALALFVGAQTQLHAQGTAFTYQGRLNFNGSPAAGNFDFRFKLYADPLGNTQVGGSYLTNAIYVTNGLFTTPIDFGAGIFAGGMNWLEADVRSNGAASYTVLNPLQGVTPAPSAIFATTAGSVSGTISAAQISGTVGNSVLPASPNFTGTVMANSFSGSGANVTNVNAATLNGLSNSNFWNTSGNAGTSPANGNFLGTKDNQALVVEVNGQQAMRYEPTTDTPNLIGGYAGNLIQTGILGATIGGGGTVTGNQPNNIMVNGNYGTIAGGINNTVTNYGGAVLGGAGNFNGGAFGFIGGGNNNNLNGAYSSIGGGILNTNTGFNTVLAGGNGNLATSSYGFLGSGFYNQLGLPKRTFQVGLLPDYCNAIGGGGGNFIGQYATAGAIAGGANNSIGTNTYFGFIGGGEYNSILPNTQFATIPGGFGNLAGGSNSFAAGRMAYAAHDGSFVWSDTSGGTASFSDTGNNQFCIRAQGGVQLDPSTSLYFGASLRQMLNLYTVGSASYGIGVQASTLYFRTGGDLTGNGFAWYRGGTNSLGQNDSGGGATLMTLNNTGLAVNGGITSPMWNATNVINTNGPLGLTTSFASGGGTLVIMASGSGYCTTMGYIGMNILLDGASIDNCQVFANSVNTHLAFVPKTIVKKGLLPATIRWLCKSAPAPPSRTHPMAFASPYWNCLFDNPSNPMTKKLLLLLGWLIPATGFTQNYSIDWYKVADGGGTSSGGNFSVSGTIGQPDASSAMTGGNYSLTGGFWSPYTVQIVGFPTLCIRLVAPNSAVVSWANIGSHTLQTNSNPATASWLGYGGNISLSGGTNSVTISPTAGNLFFRLK